MTCNNQGIMHAAPSRGGQPYCKTRNSHMSTTIDRFRDEPRKCKRCEAKVAKMDAVKAKNAARASFVPVTVKGETACEQFVNWPLVLVIHVNNFTRRIDGGYIMRHGVKQGPTMTPKDVAEYLRIDPVATPVEFLKV